MSAVIGFGSYRVGDRDPVHRQALERALAEGIRLIDTSANYGGGAAERLIGDVAGCAKDVTIVTKAGFTSLGGHSMNPEFLESELTASLGRLKRENVDTLLLHNPETELEGMNGDHGAYYDAIARAFEHLEKEVSRGRISRYGVSSNSFGDEKSSPDFTSLEALCGIADQMVEEKALKRHHFGVVQFPLNLFEPGVSLEPNNGGISCARFAESKGIFTMVNRPLNAFKTAGQGRALVRLADFPDHPEQDFQARIQADLDAAVALEARYPVSAREILPARELAWGHVLRENLPKMRDALAWREAFASRIKPSLEDARIRFEANPEAAQWLRAYLPVAGKLFESVTAYLEYDASFRSQHVSQALDHLSPELARLKTLSQKALTLYRSLPGISSVLVGMRRPEYVADVATILAGPTLLPHEAEEVLLGFATQEGAE